MTNVQTKRSEVLGTAAAILAKRDQVDALNREIASLTEELDKLLEGKAETHVVEAAEPARAHAKGGETYAKFLRVVGRLRGTFGPKDIPADAGLSEGYTGALFAQATAQGKLKRLGRGRYKNA